jgi:type IV pilus assembly protein PilY1
MSDIKTNRYWTRHHLVVMAVLLITVIPLSQVLAEECEIPLFVKQSLTGANVMILADNSGSMNAAVYHLAYDSKTEYTGPFHSESQWYISRNMTLEPTDFNTGFPAGPSVSFVDSDNGQSGRYMGNYLNWMFYHATEDQRNSIPQVTRIQVLKEVLCEVINRSARLKFGLTVFQYDHGGNIIGKCGVNPTSLKATINGITANTWTPLGESMETIVDYFSYDGPDAAIEVPCQYNFCLVITDGLPTMDREVSGYLVDADGDGNDPGDCDSIGAPYPNTNDCSDHFDDVAYHMAHEDLRPDMDGDQFVFTYVVGFHEDGLLLKDAAANGDGLFFPAENAVELVLSIEYAINDILRRISSGSAVAVVSTERGVDDRLYRGKFMPIDWDGFLECYALPYSDGDAAIWEAGEILRQRPTSERRIFTAVNGVTYNFDSGRSDDLRDALGVATNVEAADLINWVRGDAVEGLRDRHGWILGDIVHSTPVVVGAPAGFVANEALREFHANYANRDKIVYVGVNDGMLHAFDAESGRERWSFIPEFALPGYTTMADSGYCHKYSCDQTPTVQDIQISGQWSTVLVSSVREGGDAVFALDITEPDSPDVLWQIELPNGKTYASEVELVSIGGTSVALIGGGLDEVDGLAWLYAYNAEDGTFLGELEISDSRDRNKLTRPAVVDLNLDGEVDLLYVGDLEGSLWRIAVNGSPNPGSWDVSELFSSDSEITASPVAAYGPNGSVYVYFGTGSYLTDDDMMTLDENAFVCVYDLHNGNTNDFRDLTDQTDNIDAIDTDTGWYVTLDQSAGERITEQAVVVAETVIFTSFAPTMDACVAGGESWLYQMAYDTGGLAYGGDQEAPEDRITSLGEGIASYPVVDLAQGTVVVQSSDASISVENIAGSFERMQIRSWQEDFQHVDDVIQ